MRLINIVAFSMVGGDSEMDFLYLNMEWSSSSLVIEGFRFQCLCLSW